MPFVQYGKRLRNLICVKALTVYCKLTGKQTINVEQLMNFFVMEGYSGNFLDDECQDYIFSFN